jgi:hypothetical protein
MHELTNPLRAGQDCDLPEARYLMALQPSQGPAKRDAFVSQNEGGAAEGKRREVVVELAACEQDVELSRRRVAVVEHKAVVIRDAHKAGIGLLREYMAYALET